MESSGYDMRREPFKRIEVDVTDTCVQACLCVTCPLTFLPLVPGFMGKKKLVMDEEEAVLTTDCPCCTSVQRRPYGELGGVEKGTCLCLTCLSGDLFSIGGGNKGGCIIPGGGCNNAKTVEHIYDTLKERMANRGDTGQVRRAEEHLDQMAQLRKDMDSVNQKLDLIMSHLRIGTIQRA